MLLILAGVTIAALSGPNGILTNATKSKKQTEIESVKEQAKLDISNWIAKKLEKGEDTTLYDFTIKEILETSNLENRNPYYKELQSDKLISLNGYEIPYSDFCEVVSTPPIPTGFYPVSGSTIENGFVISDLENDVLNDSKGNQYVWIPVDGILGEDGTVEDVKKKDDKNQQKILLGRYIFDVTGEIDTEGTFIPENITGSLKPDKDGYNSYWDGSEDVLKFVKSVRENKGYYIARFEASQSEEGKIESKYNKPVLTGLTKSQALEACKNLYDGVNSYLANSFAWDTAMLFIQKYSGDEFYSQQKSLSSSPSNTGMATDGNNFDVRCNLYDMAGNYAEWTTETFSAMYSPAVYRGGYYVHKISNASSRNYSENDPSGKKYYTFRSILYL